MNKIIVSTAFQPCRHWLSTKWGRGSCLHTVCLLFHAVSLLDLAWLYFQNCSGKIVFQLSSHLCPTKASSILFILNATNDSRTTNHYWAQQQDGSNCIHLHYKLEVCSGLVSLTSAKHFSGSLSRCRRWGDMCLHRCWYRCIALMCSYELQLDFFPVPLSVATQSKELSESNICFCISARPWLAKVSCINKNAVADGLPCGEACLCVRSNQEFVCEAK